MVRFPLGLLVWVACSGEGEVGSTVEQSEEDSGGSSDGGTDSTVAGAQLEPVFSQDGGGFVGELEVELRPIDGIGEVFACVAVPAESCAPTDVGERVVLTESALVHAQVVYGDARGPVVARAFHALDDSTRGWESTLPVMMFWTESSVDALVDNTPVGLSVLSPRDGVTTLDIPPSDSGRARLRVRGSSSAGLDKKAFDVELWDADDDGDRSVELLGMPADADWVLYAPYYFDDALMRNPLAYQLSRDVGRYAPRTRFVEVYLASRGRDVDDASYLGVYVLTEEIERGASRVDVKRLDVEDVTEPEISGGYVFKRDRLGDDDEPIWAGSASGRLVFRQPIVMVDPESDDMADAQLEWLAAELDAMSNALVDGTDPETGRPYSEIIDVGSFIDHHIVNVYFKNPDAFRLSGYFFKDRDGPIHAGPVWDFDRTAGSVDQRAQDPYHWDATNFTSDTTPVFTYGWYGPLFDDPVFRIRYWARFSALLRDELSLEATLGHIDAMQAELGDAGARNQSRWGRPDFDAEVSALRDWFRARHSWLETCISTHEDPRSCAG